MKYLGIILVILGLSACSNSPTKLERIEANEAAIANLQTVVTTQEAAILDLLTRPENMECPAACNVKIDRMFEKAQYK